MTAHGLSVRAFVMVFMAVAGAYLMTSDFRPITDSALNSLQTRALVLHGDFDLRRYQESGTLEVPLAIPLADGSVRSIYGVAISLTAAPFYALLLRLNVGEASLQTFVAIMFASAAAAFVFVQLRRMFDRRITLLGTLLFAFGTTMWPVATTSLWQQGPVAMFIAAGMVMMFSKHGWSPAAAGALFAWAAFIRPVLGLFPAVIGGLYLIRRRRDALLFVGGALLPVIAIFAQNRWLWGSWLAGGYTHGEFGFDADPLVSVSRQAVGWWRGLFVYSPALVLIVPGLVALIRDRRAEVAYVKWLVGASLAVLALYARWTIWWGGLAQFGYRFPLDVMPVLVIVAASIVQRIPRLRPIAAVLVAVSIVIMAAGMAPDRRGWEGVPFPDTASAAPIGRALSAVADDLVAFVARLLVVTLAGLVIWWSTARTPAVPAYQPSIGSDTSPRR